MNEQKINNNKNVYDVKINKNINFCIGLSPLIFGSYILILGYFAISFSQAIISYVNFISFTYLSIIVAYMFQKLFVKRGLLRILKCTKLEEGIPLSELSKTLKIKIDLKELKRKWLFHCYCSFGLSLGFVNTVLRFFLDDLQIRYFIVGGVYFISPILVLLYAPAYFIVKDATSHFNEFIAKSIRGMVHLVGVFTLLFFIKNMFTITYDLVTILSLSSFFLYNLLSNLVICFVYYTGYEESKRSHCYFVKWFINSLKIKLYCSRT